MENIETRLNAINNKISLLKYNDPAYDILVVERNRLLIKLKQQENPVEYQRERVRAVNIKIQKI